MERTGAEQRNVASVQGQMIYVQVAHMEVIHATIEAPAERSVMEGSFHLYQCVPICGPLSSPDTIFRCPMNNSRVELSFEPSIGSRVHLQ